MKDFDELLDSVLQEDAAAQPRVGFETRVMARVRAEAGHGSRFGFANRRSAWVLGPVAACLGIVAAIWYVSGGVLSQPRKAALHIFPPVLSVEKPGIESLPPEAKGNAGFRLGGSGRALRDAHLSDGRTVAKMGHPVMFAHRVRSLPKLDALPSPTPMDVFPRPVPASDGADQSSVMALRSQETGLPPLLSQEQNEPIRIAAIEIAPLAIKPIDGLSEKFIK